MFWVVPVTFLATWLGTTVWYMVVGPIPPMRGATVLA